MNADKKYRSLIRVYGSSSGGQPIFALHHPHGGCPILAFFARVGGDAAGATLVRSTPPVVYAVVVPVLFAYAKDGAPASSYFACASFVTTAATLSSIWFQPST